MLKLDTSDETIIRNWPVIINVPQDGGTIAKHEITVDFMLLSQDRYSELLKDFEESGTEPNVEMLKRLVRGIKGVADESGNPLEFSEELLARLTKKAYVRVALFNAYTDANTGNKAKRKN